MTEIVQDLMETMIKNEMQDRLDIILKNNVHRKLDIRRFKQQLKFLEDKQCMICSEDLKDCNNITTCCCHLEVHVNCLQEYIKTNNRCVENTRVLKCVYCQQALVYIWNIDMVGKLLAVLKLSITASTGITYNNIYCDLGQPDFYIDYNGGVTKIPSHRNHMIVEASGLSDKLWTHIFFEDQNNT